MLVFSELCLTEPATDAHKSAVIDFTKKVRREITLIDLEEPLRAHSVNPRIILLVSSNRGEKNKLLKRINKF